MVLDEMAQIKPQNDEKALVLMFAALCHDFGKPDTTQKIDGRLRSHGHEKAGIKPTKQCLKRLTDHKALINEVLPLVEHHLKPALLYKSNQVDGVSDVAIRHIQK